MNGSKISWLVLIALLALCGFFVMSTHSMAEVSRWYLVAGCCAVGIIVFCHLWSQTPVLADVDERSNGSALRVRERLQIHPKTTLLRVDAGGQELLLGLGHDGAVTPLSVLGDSDELALLHETIRGLISTPRGMYSNAPVQ